MVYCIAYRSLFSLAKMEKRFLVFAIVIKALNLIDR